MLVLKRSSHQKITIGDNITITICEIRGNQVAVGVDAPMEMVVMRKDAIDEKEKPNA